MPIKRVFKSGLGSRRLVVIVLLWSGLWWAGSAWASSMHHNGCENPEADVQVCWDVLGDAGEEFAPFADVHLLPIAWEREGEPQLLADYTRTVFRQLLPSGFADKLTQEWSPATHLEGAMAMARLHQWALTLWISPRVLRESSPTSAGIVDWDIYLIKHNKMLRTMRVRVEARPKQGSTRVTMGTGVGALLVASGAALTHPIASTATVVGAMAMAPLHPPEAGRPLELNTEFAVRQMLTAFKTPMERMKSTVPPSGITNTASQWLDQIFSPK